MAGLATELRGAVVSLSAAVQAETESVRHVTQEARQVANVQSVPLVAVAKSLQDLLARQQSMETEVWRTTGSKAVIDTLKQMQAVLVELDQAVRVLSGKPLDVAVRFVAGPTTPGS